MTWQVERTVRSAQAFRSKTMPRLFRFIIRNAADSPALVGGVMRCASSPPVFFRA